MKRFVIASGLAALSLVVAATSASADDAACGEVYESVTLQHDLACDISVQADGIVIDLNGFSVDGRIGLGETGWTGLSDVTIRNGTASQVEAWYARSLHLEDLETNVVLRSSGVTMTGVVASGRSEESRVVFREGVLGGMSGRGDWGCGTWDVAGSTVESLTTGWECDVTITDSEVHRVDGFTDYADGSLRLESSTVSGPVSVGGFIDVTVLDNHFTGPDAGLSVRDLRRPRSTPMVVRGNWFAGGGGVSIGIADATLTFDGNVVQHAEGDGLTIGEGITGREAPLGTVRGNWFLANGGTGLRTLHAKEFGHPTFLIADNRAVGNAGHGIDAPGDIDGGGNVAGGNGLTPACIGVTCSTK